MSDIEIPSPPPKDQFPDEQHPENDPVNKETLGKAIAEYINSLPGKLKIRGLKTVNNLIVTFSLLKMLPGEEGQSEVDLASQKPIAEVDNITQPAREEETRRERTEQTLSKLLMDLPKLSEEDLESARTNFKNGFTDNILELPIDLWNQLIAKSPQDDLLHPQAQEEQPYEPQLIDPVPGSFNMSIENLPNDAPQSEQQDL